MEELRHQRVLILLGNTGAGKSTIANALINSNSIVNEPDSPYLYSKVGLYNSWMHIKQQEKDQLLDEKDVKYAQMFKISDKENDLMSCTKTPGFFIVEKRENADPEG